MRQKCGIFKFLENLKATIQLLRRKLENDLDEGSNSAFLHCLPHYFAIDDSALIVTPNRNRKDK